MMLYIINTSVNISVSFHCNHQQSTDRSRTQSAIIMTSLNLSKPAANFPQTKTQKVPPPQITSFKPKHCTLPSCRLQSLPYKQSQVTEPSISSSTSAIPKESPLKIGIVGLGAFGQFLARAFQRQGHTVLGTSRSDYKEYCQEHGIQFFRQLDDLCDAQPDVLLICSSIISTEDVVRGIPFHKLKPDTIIADVLSVKQFAKDLLLEVVPSGFGILCTHPMFGKFSGKNSWEGLRFVYDKVRITRNNVQERKCERFLDIFQDEGCRMIEMSCELHDKYAAESQFLTHTVARILAKMNLEATPIDTKGYETLRELTQNTVSHGSDLYDGLFLYNVNSANQIKKLEKSFDEVKKNLFAKLRESLARQTEAEDTQTEEKPVTPMHLSTFLLSEEVLKQTSSFSKVLEQLARVP